MDDNRNDLKRTVDMLKRRMAAKGTDITEEEMAGKIGISGEQMSAYLNGEDETPYGLASRLKSAYNIRTFVVRQTQVVQARAPESPEDDPENIKKNRTSLKATVSFIKRCGEAREINITEEEMAGKANISGPQLHVYLNGEERTPDELPGLLWSAYADLRNAHQMEQNRKSLQHIIVLVRNRGLAEGTDITLEEMTRKIDISEEKLFAYLTGEYDTLDDLYSLLSDQYKQLLANIERVEIIEELYLDKKIRKAKLM